MSKQKKGSRIRSTEEIYGYFYNGNKAEMFKVIELFPIINLLLSAFENVI